jgi:hypothetical protein
MNEEFVIIKTVENKKYLVYTEIEPRPGDSYVFKEPDTEEWWYGERFVSMGDAGGKNVLEVLNPGMVRRKVIENLD